MLVKIIIIIVVLVFGQFAYTAEASHTQRQSSSLRNQIRNLEREDAALNLRIPILFGVKPGNLWDTWGDARSNGRTHEGIDIIVSRGEFIVSPTDAVVTTIDDSGNGGKNVSTINPGGERYYYAHLDDFAENLKERQILKAGDLIGYVGDTGNARGGPTHLHFGIYADDRRGALNPFPRLTTEFSLPERINAFTKILNDSEDSTTVARRVASQYKNIFIEAQAQGIKLPTSIIQILTEKRTEALGISRILKIGMSGDDVKWLQGALGVTADGSFGQKTKVAVAAFQLRVGLSADGVFGLTSRIALANSSIAIATLPSGCTSSIAYSPTTGVKCTPIIR